jgi:hypothetical protein
VLARLGDQLDQEKTGPRLGRSEPLRRVEHRLWRSSRYPNKTRSGFHVSKGIKMLDLEGHGPV